MLIHWFRSITTPYRLPYFAPMQSLRALLTPTERRRPWIIYLTPGLFAAQFMHLAYKIVLMGTLRRWLLPDLHSEDSELDGVALFPPLLPVLPLSAVPGLAISFSTATTICAAFFSDFLFPEKVGTKSRIPPLLSC